MEQIKVIKYTFPFKFSAGTSKGYLKEKFSYIVQYEHNGVLFEGEASLIPNISFDDSLTYEEEINSFFKRLLLDCPIASFPHTADFFFFAHQQAYVEKKYALAFACEMIANGLRFELPTKYFNNVWLDKGEPIAINGLVWMNRAEQMLQQALEKADADFECIKFKVGALDFEQECWVLREFRKVFPDKIIRLDANGAFSIEQAYHKLTVLSAFNIHSIEQPIAKGLLQWERYRDFIHRSPIKIAFDEELVGLSLVEIEELLQITRPPYVVLKPSLLGGFSPCLAIIERARALHIGYWLTSALESNMGLNAIAQFTSFCSEQFPSSELMFQGLGTGALYEWNFPSLMHIKEGKLFAF